MSTIIKINDRITWVVAEPSQPQTGTGITPDLLEPIIPTKTEDWILKSVLYVWEKAAKIKIKKSHLEVSNFVIPHYIPPAIYPNHEYSPDIPQPDRSGHIDWGNTGEVLALVGACLAPLLIFASSVGEVIVASMLSSICF